MKLSEKEWITILERNDAEALWEKLFELISRHSAIRHLYPAYSLPHSRLSDIHADLTQDLFLRLLQKQRWHHYIEAGYSNGKVEHELYHIEVPNLVSSLMRERYPESYRLVRRISTLLQTRSQFRCYQRPAASSLSARPSRRMVLKVYGLSGWGAEKPLKDPHQMAELIDTVAFRQRDTRRTGRGCVSQVIIFNDELCQLIIDIFNAIDSPAEVRTIRSLALSKLSVENVRFLSIDSEIAPGTVPDATPLKVDSADDRPTPEELLIEKEDSMEIAAMVTDLFHRMRQAVRDKPRRYRKLVQIVWHCYFTAASPSQNNIARTMRISDSLVTHYRKIFDGLVQSMRLTPKQWIAFNGAFRTRLAGVISDVEGETDSPGAAPDLRGAFTPSLPQIVSARAATAVAGILSTKSG